MSAYGTTAVGSGFAYILNNNAAGSDNDIGTDGYFIFDDGSGSDENVVADMAPAANGGVGGDVAETADGRFMLNDAVRVDDGAVTDGNVGSQISAGSNENADAELEIEAVDGAGGDDIYLTGVPL